jgi:hypothetical protein
MSRSRASFAIAVLAVVCALPAASYAEERTLEQQIQMTRSLNDAQRQATLAANVIMTDAEGAKFWPLYRDYRHEVAALNDRTEALIQRFAQNFGSMTDAEARSITNDWLAIEKQRIALKAKYVGKFQKVLYGVTAARVLQVENKLDALVQMGLAKTIPLMQP